MPVLGTYYRSYSLAEQLTNDDHVYFGTLPVSVLRNAYGRQLGSFIQYKNLPESERFP